MAGRALPVAARRQAAIDSIADDLLAKMDEADQVTAEREATERAMRARQGNILGALVGEEAERLNDVAEFERLIREAVRVADRALQRGHKVNDFASQLGWAGLSSGLMRQPFAKRLSRMLGVALGGLDTQRRFGLLDLPINLNMRDVPWRIQEQREMAGAIERIERSFK